MKELNEEKFTAYVLLPGGVKLSDFLGNADVNHGGLFLRCDSTSDRKSRANSVNALKRAIERHYGVKLERLRVTYSETYGFLSRTEIRYRVGK